jgi:hypothetical protein
MMMSIYESFGCILSWVSSSLPHLSTKRAISYAVVNAGSNFASIYVPYFYPASQGPRYWQASVANVAFSGLCIAMTTALRFFVAWRNKKLEKARDYNFQHEGILTGSQTQALTEQRQRGTEYVYTFEACRLSWYTICETSMLQIFPHLNIIRDSMVQILNIKFNRYIR